MPGLIRNETDEAEDRTGESMKRKTGLYSILILIISLGASLSAQELNITQIDSSKALLDGQLEIYLSYSRSSGGTLAYPAMNRDGLEVLDQGGNPIPVASLEEFPLRDEAITFLFLMDNSGSMHDELLEGRSRYANASRALEGFLGSVPGNKDRFALAVFNTNYQVLVYPEEDTGRLIRGVSLIEPPAPGEGYTELYSSLIRSLDSLPTGPGRKVVILLSDGENYSVFRNSGVAHPEWGENAPGADRVSSAFSEAGVSLYAASFSESPDPALRRLTAETGGAVYEPRSATELEDVYEDIRQRTLSEHRLRIAAPGIRNLSGELTVRYAGLETSREYRIPLIFGAASGISVLFPLILLAVAIIIMLILFLLSFEHAASSPQLQNLGGGRMGGNFTVQLQQNATVIGSSRKADLTIAGEPGIQGEHATIERGDDGFTLVSEQPVWVNNRKTSKRKLQAGDVIRMEGTTLVFDEDMTRMAAPPSDTANGDGAKGSTVKDE